MKSFTVVALFLLCAVLPGCETQRHGTRAGGTGRIALNASCVPAGLRDLVPLAARWGVTDPEVRDEIEKEMTAAQAGEVRDAVHSRLPPLAACSPCTMMSAISSSCGDCADPGRPLLHRYQLIVGVPEPELPGIVDLDAAGNVICRLRKRAAHPLLHQVD